MQNKEFTIKIFVKRILEAYGDWITLPMQEKDLKEAINKAVGENDFIISSIENNYPDIFYINEYSNIYALNQFLLRVYNADECDKRLLLSLYSFFDEEVEYVDKALRNLSSIDFLENVEDDKDETLGESLANSGFIGEIPSNLKEYINYEAIGRDYYCSGFKYIKSLKTAIRQNKGFGE